VPTDAEVAAELEMSEAEFDKILSQVSFTGLVALDEMFGGASGESSGATVGETVTDDTYDPAGVFAEDEMRGLLAEAIGRMPEREQRVLTLYYYEGMTLAEIGRVLGVTESRVCQIHTKAILQLRARMAEPAV